VSSAPNIEDVLQRLDRVQDLTGLLAKARGDVVQQQRLAERIRREIAAARLQLSPVRTGS
jgi:hypothetical protein